MSRNAVINDVFEVVYDTEGTQSGLVDLTISAYDPTGTNVPANDFVLTEVGTTGVYTAPWTPTVTGVHVLIANSAASNPAIADKAMAIDVLSYAQADIVGAGFVSSTDSNEALSNKLDSVLAAQNAPSARGGLI